ncbi:enoyl-CoA hydratase-related protein [Dactylosporangium sucinum]|uniref:Enoyl-CoA hydratase n=1 Tax=Dactylosporangium sucinum TaxID=1424081 RepID=A0A917WWZ2_9ACTN|nr:enoyl-CoA hydratase-related protein [Dactylosporangium sucinum]GGM35744.1 enoyl-CoA hydratase [Dactylosporangium sucinum]
MNTTAPVQLTLDGPVAVLTLHRPDRLNAWTTQMEDLYFDHLADLAADADVRAVIVTGAGRGFCAGADMDELTTLTQADATDTAARRPQTFPLTVPKPIIAAVNGPCAGIGLVQALMCDVRIAAEDAKFTTAFSRLGLIAEHGLSWLLAKHVGLGNALDLLISSRVVTAKEAREIGLVSSVCPAERLLPVAMDYARSLATGISPGSMATMKAQLYEHYGLTLADALLRSNELMLRSFAGTDFVEGIAAFRQRRAPAFPGISRDPGDAAT